MGMRSICASLASLLYFSAGPSDQTLYVMICSKQATLKVVIATA